MFELNLNSILEEGNIYRALVMILTNLVNIYKFMDSKEEKERKVAKVDIFITDFLKKDNLEENIFKKKLLELRVLLNKSTLYETINNLNDFIQEQKILNILSEIEM